MLSFESTISNKQDSRLNSSVDNNNLIQNSGSSSTLTFQSPSIRKRRAAFKIKKHEFTSLCAKTAEIAEESDENNAEIESLVSSPSSSYNSGNETSSASENTDDSSGEEEQQLHLKRLRFDSTESPNFLEEINDGIQQNEEEHQSIEKNKNLEKQDVLEKECSLNGLNSSPVVGQLPFLILEDSLTGKCYEIISFGGRNCKAKDLITQEIWHCQTLEQNEFNNLMEIVSRMKSVSNCYSEEGFVERSNLLLPLDQFKIIRSTKQDLIYILLPNHYDTLEKFIDDECGEVSSPNWRRPACLSERLVQQFLKQICILLEFCHRIGLFFRDFRLYKFVFTDPEKTKLRLNSVLDLYISPRIDSDLIDSREFIPVYVSPEVLDKRNVFYSGRAADIWAFGVMMFSLLDGRFPFFEPNHNPIALLRRIRLHSFSFSMRSNISEPARWLVHSLLKPCPNERPSAFQILQAHWFRNISIIGTIWGTCSSHVCKHIEKLQRSNIYKVLSLRDCPFLNSTRIVPNGAEWLKYRRKLTVNNNKKCLINPLRSFIQEQSESVSTNSQQMSALNRQVITQRPSPSYVNRDDMLDEDQVVSESSC